RGYRGRVPAAGRQSQWSRGNEKPRLNRLNRTNNTDTVFVVSLALHWRSLHQSGWRLGVGRAPLRDVWVDRRWQRRQTDPPRHIQRTWVQQDAAWHTVEDVQHNGARYALMRRQLEVVTS